MISGTSHIYHLLEITRKMPMTDLVVLHGFGGCPVLT